MYTVQQHFERAFFKFITWKLNARYKKNLNIFFTLKEVLMDSCIDTILISAIFICCCTQQENHTFCIVTSQVCMLF